MSEIVKEKELPIEEIDETDEKWYEDVDFIFEHGMLNNTLVQEKSNKDGKNEYGIFIKFKDEDIKIATISSDGTLIPNKEILKDERYAEKDRKYLEEMLNLLGREKDKVNVKDFQEFLKTIEAKTREQIMKERNINEGNKTPKDKLQEHSRDENNNEDEQEPEMEEDKIKEDEEKNEIALKYNVNSKDVVHLNTRGKKLTERESFGDLVHWAEGKDDVYVIGNRKGMIQAVVEKKNGEYEEIKQDMEHVHGNNPTVKIHLITNERVETVTPLQIYQIDSKQALATIRNDWGDLETIYCRKEEGKEEYFGEIVPEEKSGKNVRQLEHDARAMMDPKNTSARDLSKKHDEIKRVENLEARDVPSDKKYVEQKEIGGSKQQNRALTLENIKEDLMRRHGIENESSAPPCFYDVMAKKVLKKVEEEGMKYPDAVEEVEKEQKGDRPEGGTTPVENNRKRDN